MSRDKENLEETAPILVIILSVYYLLIWKFFYTLKDSQAIYSRSYFLVKLSTLFNYLSTGLFIWLGSLITKDYQEHDIWVMILSLAIVALNNIFYITNYLKAYRIVILSKLSTGDYELKATFKLKNQLTISWNLKIYSV